MDKPGSTGSGVLLKNLFSQIMYEKRLTGRYSAFMFDWINNPRNGVKQTQDGKISARNNLRKELEHPEMTWKVFCKAMRWAQFPKFEISIRPYSSLTEENPPATTLMVNLGKAHRAELEVPPWGEDEIPKGEVVVKAFTLSKQDKYTEHVFNPDEPRYQFHFDIEEEDTK